MPIKEFCLVPRSEVEAKKKRPISLPETKIAQQNVKKESLTSEVDTSIEDAVKILFKPSVQQYVDGIISYLRKHPIIRWDDTGNIVTPIQGVNLFDIIHFWVTQNSNFDSSKIPDLRMMVKLIGLPKTYVKNTKARKQLFTGGNLQSNFKSRFRWEPY